MTRLIEFAEFYSDKPKQQEKHAGTYLIDPGQVGAVIPKRKYTSLLVQGYWFHVAGTHEEVLRKLGFQTGQPA